MEELHESLPSNFVMVSWDCFSWGPELFYQSVCSRSENGSDLDIGQKIVNFYWSIHLQPLGHPSLNFFFHTTAWVIPLHSAHLSWHFTYSVLLTISWFFIGQLSWWPLWPNDPYDNCVYPSFFQLSAATRLLFFQDPFMHIVIREPSSLANL